LAKAAWKESKGLQVDDPTRDVQSSKNELRQTCKLHDEREVGNERTSPHAVEWDCSMVHEQTRSDSGLKGSRPLQRLLHW
jgi:hypothetical protein